MKFSDGGEGILRGIFWVVGGENINNAKLYFFCIHIFRYRSKVFAIKIEQGNGVLFIVMMTGTDNIVII